MIDHTKGCVPLITHTFFTEIYARKEESLQIDNWFRQVMLFENWSTLAFFSIIGKLSTELCVTKIRKMRIVLKIIIGY